MSETKNSATFTFGYTNTDFTRKYKVDGISAAGMSGIKAGILALNASMEAGTAGGLSTFFLSDDYDASNPALVVGNFKGIIAAQSDSVQETNIPLFE